MGSPDARQVLRVLLGQAGIELDPSDEEQLLAIWRQQLPRLEQLRRRPVPGYAWPMQGMPSHDA